MRRVAVGLLLPVMLAALGTGYAFGQTGFTPPQAVLPTDCESPAPYIQTLAYVVFDVDADGSVRNVALLRSTHSEVLDAAATTCAKGWSYKPATRDGTPVATRWQQVIRWKPNPDFVPPKGAKSNVPCDPHKSDGAQATRAPEVRYTIGTDGNVSIDALETSSNAPAFDATLQECVSRWHFEPGRFDGRPVAVMRDASLLLPNVIYAQTEASQTVPVHMTSAPAAIGRPHVCPVKDYYPPLAIRLHHEGVTTLAFTVASDGRLSDIRVLTSSGFPELDEAAIVCAAPWTYRPAMRDGQTVAVPYKANVRWKLPDEAPQPGATP